MTRSISLGLALVCVAACDVSTEVTTNQDPTECAGPKCDLPQEDSDTLCSLRQSEVLDSSRRAFTPEAVRWACDDVQGVNTLGTDDRGQEYCEYYAIFDPQLGGLDVESTTLGRQRSAQRGDVSPPAICIEGFTDTDCGVTVPEELLFAMEDEPDAVVGSCIFTTWHSDVPGPLPSCADGECPTVHGFPMDEEFGRMKLATNSNETASDVIQFCVDAALSGQALPDDFTGDPSDPFAEPFYRGCRLTGLFDLEWRRSDPAICAAINRMVECGCSVPGVLPEEIGNMVVPPQPTSLDEGAVTFRGFSLGSWTGSASSDLPAGCEHVDSGENQNNIVRCDLLAADVLEHLNDPKEACRFTYGDQIVAYAKIPADQVECTGTLDAAGAACGSMPWNIGEEG